MKIFGPSVEKADQNPKKNANIYNDGDFYQVLLTDFLNMNDSENAGDPLANQNTEGDYLYGADLSLTQKYLEKRQKIKELNL